MNRPPATLFELYWHDDRLTTFVVQAQRELQVRHLRLPLNRVQEDRRSFHKAFRANDVAERKSGAWTELSTIWLEAQLGTFIETGGPIIFVPHGVFHHWPLHLLSYRRKPLARLRPVMYSPSATLLVKCRDRSQCLARQQYDGRLLAIGVDFEQEAEGVALAIPGSPLWLYSRGEVNKTKVLAALNRYAVIHFSCHGLFDHQRPMNSGLVLKSVGQKSPTLDAMQGQADSLLTAAEIATQRIGAGLVSLSACETGLKEALPGDELIGLTRALLLAGAASVLLSFWPVPEGPTADFMAAFYRALFRRDLPGRSVARGLRQHGQPVRRSARLGRIRAYRRWHHAQFRLKRGNIHQTLASTVAAARLDSPCRQSLWDRRRVAH